MADQNDLSSLVACLQSMTSELQKYHASQEAVVEQFKQSNELLLRIASPAENDGQIEGASPPANLEANPYP